MTPLFWCAIMLIILIVVVAILVPFSVLTWWAGWRKHTAARPAAAVTPPTAPPSDGPFLVYLSGIGDISGEYQTVFEDDFLAAIAERVPGLQVITDVFGFSVDNMSMTSQRELGWFWSWVNKVRLRKGSPLKPVGKLINMRNTLHLAISADQRYGPIYNYGVAEMILQGLLRHGYSPGSGAPITLLGYSGGGQVALATSGYIQATLLAPVQVISLAGVMNSNPSLDQISTLTHLYGTKDKDHRLGQIIFPARWPIFQGSRWSQALAEGKIRMLCLGPMVHTGKGSYLDATAHVEDGRSFRDITADTVAELICQLGPGRLVTRKQD